MPCPQEGDTASSPFQVLLSQVHRLRALDLLGRFLDLGPWAVSLVRASCISRGGVEGAPTEESRVLGHAAKRDCGGGH